MMKKTENVSTINLENMLSELYSLETQRKRSANSIAKKNHRRSRESKIIEAKKTAARRSRAAEDVGNISYIRVAERANEKLNEHVLDFDEM